MSIRTIEKEVVNMPSMPTHTVTLEHRGSAYTVKVKLKPHLVKGLSDKDWRARQAVVRIVRKALGEQYPDSDITQFSHIYPNMLKLTEVTHFDKCVGCEAPNRPNSCLLCTRYAEQ